MRRLALLLAVMASPALAQSDRDRAGEMIADSMIEGGFDAEISTLVADCYTSRMTDAEVAALVSAAGDVPAEQAIIAEHGRRRRPAYWAVPRPVLSNEDERAQRLCCAVLGPVRCVVSGCPRMPEPRCQAIERVGRARLV